MKTVLITGGAGFIGCSVAGQLLARQPGLRIVAMDNLHPQVHQKRDRPVRLPSAVELVLADVCDPLAWDGLLGDLHPDAILHLAAETGTGQSLKESTRHAMVNVVGTTTMFDALVRADRMPQQILLTSSRAVYGEGAWRDDQGNQTYPGQRTNRMLTAGQWDFPGLSSLPFSATTTLAQPTSIYGSTKLAQEHLLTSWCNSFDVKATVLRLQNVYGPGQSLTNPYTGIVPLFARLARGGESIPLYEDGKMLRDFVYIEDVSAAIVNAFHVDKALPHALDVGTGNAISIAELAAIVAGHYGAPSAHVCGLFRDGDVRHASCVIDDTRKLLGWAPATDVADGITELCRWIDSGAI
jgi:dTDP-L-rhamnose 4-epimerase